MPGFPEATATVSWPGSRIARLILQSQPRKAQCQQDWWAKFTCLRISKPLERQKDDSGERDPSESFRWLPRSTAGPPLGRDDPCAKRQQDDCDQRRIRRFGFCSLSALPRGNPDRAGVPVPDCGWSYITPLTYGQDHPRTGRKNIERSVTRVFCYHPAYPGLLGVLPLKERARPYGIGLPAGSERSPGQFGRGT